jgi:1-phosphofructokinase family hexose kinase
MATHFGTIIKATFSRSKTPLNDCEQIMIYTLTLNPGLDLELTVAEMGFDQVLRASAVRSDCGGKGFNVSRALAALGERSVAMGLLGGKTGERLEDELSRLGIATDFVRLAGETRTNISIVTDPATHYLKVNQPGPAITAGERQALLEKVRTAARPGDWWALSGSLPPGIPAGFYGELIEAIQLAGARAILDSSGAPLAEGCRARPFLVKPNAGEAADLTGLDAAMPDGARAAAEKILESGVELALVSIGKQGALLAGAAGAWLGRPPAVEERNPVGAGDALVAGTLRGLAHGLPLPEVLRWGVACGSAAASLPGTGVGDLEMVEAIRGGVEVRGM